MSRPLEEYTGFAVALERFAGPLDLLLSLIRREQVDIFDIPIAHITDQYLAALEGMRENRLEVSGEFVAMAATLMQIKSRLLLPRPEPLDAGEASDDPRRELVELLLEYQRYRGAAELLGDLAGARGRLFGAPGEPLEAGPPPLREVGLSDLLRAWMAVLEQAEPAEMPRPREVEVTVAEQAAAIRRRLALGASTFADLFDHRPTRLEVVVMFMALLELIRLGEATVEQDALFGEIRVRAAAGRSAAVA